MAFYGWYLGLMDSKAQAATGLPIERVDPFAPTLDRERTERERPYYNLWPCIVPCLSKLRMDAAVRADRRAGPGRKPRRRGHWGWNVGKAVEVSPHVRAASPVALYWTGEGRKIPKIRFRRGTVVHRKKFAEVPTGFLGQEAGGD